MLKNELDQDQESKESRKEMLSRLAEIKSVQEQVNKEVEVSMK